MALASQDAARRPPEPTGPNSRFGRRSTARRKLNPTKLAYLIGPVVFAVILLLMRFGYAARVHWLGVARPPHRHRHRQRGWRTRYYTVHPGRMSLNLRVASQVTAVTLAIYLTGWGPVLWAAYIFVALENLARAGSRVWRTTVLCSLIGMTFGQFCARPGLAPVRADAGPRPLP